MLRTLHVKNFVTIDELSISFDGGLNIITGETGAGKSVIVSALKLVLGARTSSDKIRRGAAKAIVEATLSVGDDPGLIREFEHHQLDYSPTLILRREITPSQSRAFVNDSPATLLVLKRIASHLVDLHGQHEHQSLLQVSRHLKELDAVGNLRGSVESYQDEYRTLQDRSREIIDIRQRLSADQDRKELNEFRRNEISAVDPAPEEDEKLFERVAGLQNAEQLKGESSDIVDTLLENDDSVVASIHTVIRKLESLARADSSLVRHISELQSALVTIEEVCAELRSYSQSVEVSPEALEEASERLSSIEHLKKKYGGSLQAVLELQRELAEAVGESKELENRLEQLVSEYERHAPVVVRWANKLSNERRTVAAIFEKDVAALLADLGMEGSRFEVRFSALAAGLQLRPDQDEISFGPDGKDIAEFYISANKGMEVKPLRDVASGGEISRIMLALKSLLASSMAVPVLVFDEIDTGISGSVANKVGARLHAIGKRHQVIAITHLPQIAAHADHHFVVEKKPVDGLAQTSIRKLTYSERAAEVAMLLGEGTVSETALEHAKSLLAVSTN